ncbi:helix-turn-helix domain-containing protein [Frankia sp. CiP3]|uniref:helix-turn-helix domain-containing protein n=1 Tax=Frankia sp. CiP3 TaxID=2880971 RepID=UPI001EF5F8EA|nr:helix-turn-helix domain-containing protein [Frankia sp. CiP3]
MAAREPSAAVREICAILSRLRGSAGLTDLQLAERCGYSVSHLNAIRNGKITKPPPDEKIEKWVRACAANDDVAEFALAEIRELAAVDERQRDLEKTAGSRAPDAASPSPAHPEPVGTNALPRVVATAGHLAWNIPARLPRFVGRDQLLADLGVKLAEARVALVALDGMGGIGKTSIAVEYAHRHASDLALAWWIPSEQAELIGQHVASLGEHLGLPAGSDPSVVWAALRRVGSWLVVFDNVANADAIRAFQPSGGGRVLVTSRLRGVRKLGVPFSVPLLERDASVELIRDRVPAISLEAASKIASLVEDLPLAVDQAAGYLDETGTPAARYSELLAATPHISAAGVASLSVNRLRADKPAAVALLELLAFCAADPVPLSLFMDHVELLAACDSLQDAVKDPRIWTDTVGALISYNLAAREQDTLTVHPVIAADVRAAVGDVWTFGRLLAIAKVLNQAVINLSEKGAGWQSWRLLLAHALTVADHIRLYPSSDESLKGLFDILYPVGRNLTATTAYYLRDHGQSAAAVPLFEQNATDCVHVLGPEHEEALEARDALATAYDLASRNEEATALHEENLVGIERALGAEHELALRSRNHLANAWSSGGQILRAIALYEQNLEIATRTLSADNRTLLLVRLSLAAAYQRFGDAERSIVLLERILADQRRFLGSDHPDLLVTRGNLASGHLTNGHTGRAIALREQNLHDLISLRGPDHPDTLIGRRDLAEAYQKAGRTKKALSLYEQTFADQTRVLGLLHPHTLVSGVNLAAAHSGAGNNEQAITLYEQSQAGLLRLLGPGHRDTVAATCELATAYAESGRMGMAINLYKKALADGEKTLHTDDEVLITIRRVLTLLRVNLGR